MLIYYKRVLALKYINALTLLLSSSRVRGVMSSLQSGRDAWFKLNRPRRAAKTTEVDIVELQKRISENYAASPGEQVLYIEQLITYCHLDVDNKWCNSLLFCDASASNLKWIQWLKLWNRDQEILELAKHASNCGMK